MQVQWVQLNTSPSSVRKSSKKNMEGKGLKSVIMCALILGLVVEQIAVEGKSCCRTTTERNIYNSCRFAGGSREACAKLSGCKHVTGKCPSGWNKFNLVPDFEAAVYGDYCKLGCTSSLCNAITTDVGSDEHNSAVEDCNNACSRFCSKDTNAVA